MEEDFDDTTMDACLIAAGQRAEHYEMAAYGTLIAWAKAMGHDEAAEAAAGDARRRKGGRREAVVAGRGRHQSECRRAGASRRSEEEPMSAGAREPWRRKRVFSVDRRKRPAAA